jgi:transposase-like protein
MIAARKKDQGSRIPLSVNKEIALESIKREHTIVDIARRYDCSRNTGMVQITPVLFNE